MIGYSGRVHSLTDYDSYEGLKRLRAETPPSVLRAARRNARRQRAITVALVVVGLLIVIVWAWTR